MKKILTVFLILMLTLSVTAFADEPKNFAENLKWGEGLDIGSTKTKDGITVASSSKWFSWSSPSIDVLPAIKEAIQGKDEAKITISFEARATFTDGNEGEVVSVTPLFRGQNNINTDPKQVDAWTQAYEESLDGEDAVFTNIDGNIMWHLSSAIQLTDEEWTQCGLTITLSPAQVNDPTISKWNLCVDNVTPPEILKTLEFKNFSITVAEEPEETPEPTPEETPKTTPEATEAITEAPATPTVPLQTPDLSTPDLSTPAPTDAAKENSSGNIIIPVIAAAAIIVVGATAFIIIKKKK